MPKIPKRKLRPPSAKTLASYGLTEADWWAMVRRQKGVCPICQQPFGDRKLAIDHEHVKGWRARKRRKSKRKVGGKRADVRLRVMTPAERRPHVRGILHLWCNGLVRSWLTLPRARSIVAYLEAHAARRGG